MTVVRRYEFVDQDGAQIEPLLREQEYGGEWNEYRTVISGVFRVLNSGSAALSPRYPGDPVRLSVL